MMLNSRIGAGVGVWVAVMIVIAVISASGGYYSGYDSGYKEGYSKGFSQAQQEIPKPILPSKLKMGVLLPLSGELGVLGREILNGIRLAIDQINISGLSGRSIILVVGDTRSDPTIAVSEAWRLMVNESVKVVIGGSMDQSTLISIAKMANQYGTVLILLPSTSPEINKPVNDPKNLIFRIIGDDGLQGVAMATLARNLGFKTAVVVAVDDDYGRYLANKINESFRAQEGTVLKSIYYSPAAKDFNATEIKELNPDVVFLIGHPESALRVIREAKAVGVASSWIACREMFNETLIRDPKVAEYLVGTYGVRLSVSNALYQQFNQTYKDRFGVEPGLNASCAYDAIMLSALAVAYAGDYNETAIRNSLFTISRFFMGLTGPKFLNDHGDVLQNYDVWEIVSENGYYKFKIVATWTPSINGAGTITWISR
ncbi:MAG: ABC transporter substrate-binding protein [Candidatus Nezhaarchaeota archaeon]|nr:ABC transporter substrate-binding protein [Candidatus Nezhaarchaeota archaeon]MCX8141371.1 ABC transporter substrate-binding protein [Candidatus Nezhaarchaeota archaeon]MDW8049637.1 ABC transporter substrate-binding protein [Nitrososphaerota archaeon]